MNKTPICPENCGHTPEQHEAFDKGLAAGKQMAAHRNCRPHRTKLMEPKLYPLTLDASPRLGCVIERHRQFTLPDHWKGEPPTDRRMDMAALIRNVGAAFQGLGDSAICAFSNLAKWMAYPPALDRMVERRDRFAANAARLDGSWKGSNRRKGKRGYWRCHAVKQSARIKAHPHFNRPTALIP